MNKKKKKNKPTFIFITLFFGYYYYYLYLLDEQKINPYYHYCSCNRTFGSWNSRIFNEIT